MRVNTSMVGCPLVGVLTHATYSRHDMFNVWIRLCSTAATAPCLSLTNLNSGLLDNSSNVVLA